MINLIQEKIPNTYLPEDLTRCAYLDPAIAQPKIATTEKTEKVAADFFVRNKEELKVALTVSLIVLCIATCVMLMVYIDFAFLILLIEGAFIYIPLCYALVYWDTWPESKPEPIDEAKILGFADKKLNPEAFKKPLLQADFPPLPEGTPEDLYKELPDLCKEVMKGEEDESEVNYMATRWISRGYNKELNHLVLLYKEKIKDPEGKKEFFRRLNSSASRGCPSGVKRELSALYRDLSGRAIATQVDDPVLRVQNKIQNENEALREKIAEKLTGNDPHAWNRYFYNLNRVISLPGAANAQNEGGSAVTCATQFFKDYTSESIAQHFTKLINEGELNPETKKREFKISKEEELIDWFKANVPEAYKEREYEFLGEVIFMEDTQDNTYKAGQIKPLAIQYLLHKCGILNCDPLTQRLLEKQALQQPSNPKPLRSATVE